ncbi:alpha/beta fold hydrolase [Nocardia amamiensis]|uniref:alpha/beta fold hydrolase n=1 Tax=Nocardia amamiensis TaxID=404578 RepID=UPI000832FD99|nr:alpha/beta hydrolase [Nocardia amamiensis]
MPTLVAGGDRDAFYPVETFRRTAAGIPDAQLVIYPGIGHMGVVVQARFAQDVVAFLGADDPRTVTGPRAASKVPEMRMRAAQEK